MRVHSVDRRNGSIGEGGASEGGRVVSTRGGPGSLRMGCGLRDEADVDVDAPWFDDFAPS